MTKRRTFFATPLTLASDLGLRRYIEQHEDEIHELSGDFPIFSPIDITPGAVNNALTNRFDGVRIDELPCLVFEQGEDRYVVPLSRTFDDAVVQFRSIITLLQDHRSLNEFRSAHMAKHPVKANDPAIPGFVRIISAIATIGVLLIGLLTLTLLLVGELGMALIALIVILLLVIMCVVPLRFTNKLSEENFVSLVRMVITIGIDSIIQLITGGMPKKSRQSEGDRQHNEPDPRAKPDRDPLPSPDDSET